MKGINRVLLVGNLTRDPELSHTGGGTAVAKFGIASNSREKGENDEWQDRADFFDVSVYGWQAEACAEHLSKGRLAGVDGRLRQDRWKDRDSGENRSKVVIIADNVQFLDSRGRDGDETVDRPHSDMDDLPFQNPPDDDIPF